MSIEMNDDIKRWTAKRKAALVMDIIQGKLCRKRWVITVTD